jgi:hypothetical protein
MMTTTTVDQLDNHCLLAIPNGHDCNCVSAYLDTASGRHPCDAQNCDQSSCPAIKNSYDASARTFRTPPPIRRSDGSDALRQREARVYTAPFQVSRNDQEKLQQAVPEQQQQQQQQQQQPDNNNDGQQQQQPSQQQQQYEDQSYHQQQHQYDHVTPAGQPKKSRRTRPRNRVTSSPYDPSQQGADQDQYHPGPPHDGSQSHSDYPNQPCKSFIGLTFSIDETIKVVRSI